MPTYDYHCTACESTMEIFQSIKARPVKKCPECGKNTLQRLIGSGSGIIFKGSGFYETDYRSSSYKAQASKESSSSASSSPAVTSSDSSKTTKSPSKDESPSKNESAPKKENASKSPKSGDMKAAG
ncbi:MAG: zinc ribbon domain-containing protein [Planctomycetota bacterium]